MAKLLYQGHGSYRITTQDGRVIYVDPYAGSGYDKPADFVVVTHQHSDHNKLELITKKPNCIVITNEEALANGIHNIFEFDGIKIEAVEAKNIMHNPKKCVGYIIELDGVKVYGSGDTSATDQMKTFKEKSLDYALFCGDGIFNMGLKESAKCAETVGARHNIPIHLKPGALFDLERAKKWSAPNKLIVEVGEEILLQNKGE